MFWVLCCSSTSRSLDVQNLGFNVSIVSVCDCFNWEEKTKREIFSETDNESLRSVLKAMSESYDSKTRIDGR